MLHLFHPSSALHFLVRVASVCLYISIHSHLIFWLSLSSIWPFVIIIFHSYPATCSSDSRARMPWGMRMYVLYPYESAAMNGKFLKWALKSRPLTTTGHKWKKMGKDQRKETCVLVNSPLMLPLRCACYSTTSAIIVTLIMISIGD